MLLDFEERLSDSPFVERIWHTESERPGSFISLALSNWQMCVWQHNGKTNLTVRGPETKATTNFVPENATYVGIVFKLGTLMPQLPASSLVDGAAPYPTRRVNPSGSTARPGSFRATKTQIHL